VPKIILTANTDWYLFNFRRGLARYLRQLEHEVILVSPEGSYVSAFENEGFRWIGWKVSRKQTNPFEELDSLFALFRIYRQEQPDLVHHHTIKPVLYGTLAARLASIDLVVNSITGRGYVYISDDLKARLLRVGVSWLYRRILKSSGNEFIFENQDDRQFFVDSKFVPESQTRLIEGVGVDSTRFTPTPEPDGVPVVLMSGRMLWDKGVGVFVEAARIVKSRLSARFVLVGMPDSGNPGSIDESLLRGWHEEGVIEWWGWQSDMPAAYAQAHIITLPTSYGEGVPTALIEGAACGKPLVASEIPGCRAVIKPDHNGYLVPVGDSEALASALGKLILSPDLRRKMGQNSHDLFLGKFTYNRINQATAQVYDHLFAKAQHS
jgi:glycosyltransferase involved in cell wall biosynthesis